MAIIEALTGPLWPWIAAALSAVGVALYGRRKRAEGRTEERQDAIQEDVENAKRIRERADAARADTGGGDAVDRLRERHPDRLRD